MRRRGLDLGGLLAGALRRADADVVRAEQPDLGDRLAPGALADREHRHHGGHAEHHAERGEQGAQFVGEDAVDANPQGLGVLDHGSRRAPVRPKQAGPGAAESLRGY